LPLILVDTEMQKSRPDAGYILSDKKWDVYCGAWLT